MTDRPAHTALPEHLTKYVVVYPGWGRPARNRSQAIPSREDKAPAWSEQHQTFPLPHVITEEGVA